MFEKFSFHIVQGRYIKAVMNRHASYRPDGKEPENAQDFIDDGNEARRILEDKTAAHDLAHSQFNQRVSNGHAACVKVYPIMKSRFRKDPASLDRISKLPTNDESVVDTINRMTAMSNLWGHLPNPPDTVAPFKAWATMGKTEFDALLASITTLQETLPDIDEDLEDAQADFHTADNALEDFITAALTEGRNQFDGGTPEREAIDAIPTEPAAQPPGQAVFTDYGDLGGGVVKLEADASHGMTYTFLEKRPGAPAYVAVATDQVEKALTLTGRTPGSYDYKVIPHNSRGDGPESEVLTIAVS